MKAPGLPADQQFFADLFSGWCLTRNYWGASGLPASLPRYRWAVYVLIFPVWISCCAANTATCWKQSSSEWWKEKCCLFRHARLIYRSTTKPMMLLSLVFAPTWLGLSFYDSRTTSLLHPARQIQLPSLQRGEGEAMLTALTHLSRSPLEQNIIQPLVLSLLHLCRNVVNMPPGNSQPRGDFLYHSICNWVQDNYAQPLTRESVAQFFNITPNHLSKLFAQHGTMRFIEYVRWVRMAKARMILQKYHLSIHEVAQRCGFPDSDYFCRVFRRQFGLTPGEYSARFQG